MGCKDLFPNGGGIGFACSCDGYDEPTSEELNNAEETVSKEDIENYKKDFKEYVVNYCKRYNHDMYTDKDEAWFNNIAENEVEAHIESVGALELDYDNPENDAEECLSYWDS